MRKTMMLLCMLMAVFQLYAQSRTISGKVTDNNGAALSGVTVTAVGTNIRTATAANGNYVINIPATVTTLEFTSVGFGAQRVSIGNNTTLNVTMTATAAELEGVVVTGIKTVQKNEYAGASSKVTAGEINNRPVGSFDQVLQGRTPGVTSLSSSGQPGTSATIIIRGQGSIIGGTDPLYIVDGIPVEGGVFQGLNPNDFESIDILRDASAAALYGSRGSAGVIVVTTKKGKSGKMQFTYSTQYGVKSRPEFTWDMMTTSELLKAQEDYGRMLGITAGIDSLNPIPQLPGWYYSKNNPEYSTRSAQTRQWYDNRLDSISKINTNWRDVYLRTGNVSSHQIALSGGTGKTRFYSSLGYYAEEGITLRTDMKRITLRNNIDYADDNFTFSINSNLGYVKRNFQQSTTGNNLGNPFLVSNLAPVYVDPYFVPDTGSYKRNTTWWMGNATLDLTNLDMNYSDQFKATIGINAAYKITNNVTAGLTTGVDFRETQGSGYGNRTALVRRNSSSVTGRAGFQSESLGRYVSYNVRPSIGYRKMFSQKHDVDVTVYGEYVEEHVKSINMTGYGIDPRTPNTPNAITQGSLGNQLFAVVGGSKGRNAIVSGLVTARYTYSSKYTLNLSYRRDGSSKLPEVNRWTGFYSVGAIWDAAKESFISNRTFSTLRVKVSYGTSGNHNNIAGGNYPYQSTYAADQTYSGLPIQYASYPGNDDMKWETTHVLNFGIDFGLFRNRIYGDINLYDKRTKDLYAVLRLSATSGFEDLAVNAGELQNKGFELSLNGDVVKTRDLTASLFANVSYNKNEVLSLGPITSFEQGTELVRVGYPLGSHYEVRYGGIDAATGAPLYYGADGKLTTNYNDAPAVSDFGTWEAPWRGGFGARIKYKMFELSTLFSWQQGAHKYNNAQYFFENPGPSFLGSGANQANTLRFWQKPGDVVTSPNPLYAANFSSQYIQPADFMRLKEVAISATLPKSILSKTRILTGARLFVQGNNLLMWTNWRGMDPEAGAVNLNLSEFPNPRSFTVGLDLTF